MPISPMVGLLSLVFGLEPAEASPGPHNLAHQPWLVVLWHHGRRQLPVTASFTALLKFALHSEANGDGRILERALLLRASILLR